MKKPFDFSLVKNKTKPATINETNEVKEKKETKKDEDWYNNCIRLIEEYNERKIRDLEKNRKRLENETNPRQIELLKNLIKIDEEFMADVQGFKEHAKEKMVD